MELVDKNGLTEEEFLKNYRPGDYERPSVTVDMLIFAVDNREESIRLLLIKRKIIPSWLLGAAGRICGNNGIPEGCGGP